MPAATHAAFLRAVNLGGHRRASRPELRAVFAGLGLDGVQTFRASGNVVFATDASECELVPSIERAPARELGFAVTVYLRLRASCE
jgi:uncharacterized protein (DUF1697 family)